MPSRVGGAAAVMGRPARGVVLRSHLDAVAEVDHAVAEAASVQQFELRARRWWAGPGCRLARFDGRDQQVALVDQIRVLAVGPSAAWWSTRSVCRPQMRAKSCMKRGVADAERAVHGRTPRRVSRSPKGTNASTAHSTTPCTKRDRTRSRRQRSPSNADREGVVVRFTSGPARDPSFHSTTGGNHPGRQSHLPARRRDWRPGLP